MAFSTWQLALSIGISFETVSRSTSCLEGYQLSAATENSTASCQVLASSADCQVPDASCYLLAARCGKSLKQLLAQALQLAELLLILDKKAIVFERMIGIEMRAQHHVAQLNRIRQNCLFAQFFQCG